MCIGLPMRVVSADDVSAVAERRGELRTIGTLLVGPLKVGDHVMVHLEHALRVLDAEEAAVIDQALEGLQSALAGGDVEAYFADLTSREPQLPPHLQGP